MPHRRRGKSLVRSLPTDAGALEEDRDHRSALQNGNGAGRLGSGAPHDDLMRPRSDTFAEVFRAPHPLGSEGFRLLCDALGANADAELAQAFLMALDHDLAARMESGARGDAGWAVECCAMLARVSPEATAAGLGALINDGALRFHNPVVAVAFEAAGQAPALLDLIANLVETESHLLAFRVRAVEALVTRSPAAVGADGVPLDTQPALRFLNTLAEEIDRGHARTLADAWGRWAEAFAGLNRLFPEDREPPVLAWVGEALSGLAAAPEAPETMRVVLRILRANTPLPPWRPAPSGAVRDGGADAVGALIVDKAIQIALAAAGATWRAASMGSGPRSGRSDVELWPFNQRVLEAALIDGSKPPRVRLAAAGLLQVLVETSPAARRSMPAEVYGELFLDPYRRGGSRRGSGGAGSPHAESEEWLDVLLDATSDACRPIRHAAVERCRTIATAHAGWFQPRHYTRLLPLLSDDDERVRVGAMKTFQALAGFRSRKVATVVGDIAARIRGETASDEEEAQARVDLDVALGVTMDRLVDDVEQLQKEVQVLEARRGELLAYIETQAIRVGEEIHHEVLNTLTGYLATAIDERDYAEAGSWLGALTQELRRIMNNLYPRDLETEGFLATIAKRLSYAKAHLDRRGQPCQVALDRPPEVTDAVIEACVGDASRLVLLYRIVLEAVNNARKHSRGTRIGVSVRTPVSGALEIRVSDDGRAQGGPFGENVGMALMRRRAEEIGATIDYGPTPGGGTTVTVRLGPANAPADDQTKAAPTATPDAEADTQ